MASWSSPRTSLRYGTALARYLQVSLMKDKRGNELINVIQVWSYSYLVFGTAGCETASLCLGQTDL